MSHELEDALAQKFIARPDVKAIQRGSAYMPVTHNRKADGERLPWSRADLTDHIDGKRSLGHYMVSTDNECKLFAFDIDLEKPKPELGKTYQWVGIEPDGSWSDMEPRNFDPRGSWLHPRCPDALKRYLRAELMTAATRLVIWTNKLLPDVPVAVSYSGSKGLHVYVLTGKHDAGELREVAREIISCEDLYKQGRGKNFYEPVGTDPKHDNPTVSIEIFPKQSDLDGKDLGNLMRLPLGKNAKTGHRAHFISLSNHVDEPFLELSPLEALEGNPWQN